MSNCLIKGGAYWETAQKSGKATSVNHNRRIKNESNVHAKGGKKSQHGAFCFWLAGEAAIILANHRTKAIKLTNHLKERAYGGRKGRENMRGKTSGFGCHCNCLRSKSEYCIQYWTKHDSQIQFSLKKQVITYVFLAAMNAEMFWFRNFRIRGMQLANTRCWLMNSN